MTAKRYQARDRIHFDPALSVSVDDYALFATPRVSCQIDRADLLHLEGASTPLNVWPITGDNGSAFLLMEDVPEATWFLFRLMAESRHDHSEPDWLKQDDYAVTTPTGQLAQFSFYSSPLLARLGADDVLMRFYTRTVADTEEFLWIILKNDEWVEHWVGIIINPAQILPG
ncbi:MAG: hypothetical protein ACR2HF_11105 [Methylococcaceae bacterium]